MSKAQYKTKCTACANVDLLEDSLIGEPVKILDEEKAKVIRQDAITKVSESMHLEMQDLQGTLLSFPYLHENSHNIDQIVFAVKGNDRFYKY